MNPCVLVHLEGYTFIFRRSSDFRWNICFHGHCRQMLVFLWSLLCLLCVFFGSIFCGAVYCEAWWRRKEVNCLWKSDFYWACSCSTTSWPAGVLASLLTTWSWIEFPLIFIKITFKKILSNLNSGANPFFFPEQMEAKKKKVLLSNLIPE